MQLISAHSRRHREQSQCPPPHNHIFTFSGYMQLWTFELVQRTYVIYRNVFRAPLCNTLKRNRRRLKGHKRYSTPHYSAFTNDKSVLTQNDLFQRRNLSNAIMTKYSTKDYLHIQCEIIRKSIQHDINQVFRLKNTQIQHTITKLY